MELLRLQNKRIDRKTNISTFDQMIKGGDVNKHLKVFKALGDRTRLRIVMMLQIRPMYVCEIRSIIGTSMSTISNHLKIMTDAEIVISHKEERYVIYELNKSDSLIAKILNIINEISDEEIEKDREKTLKIDGRTSC